MDQENGKIKMSALMFGMVSLVVVGLLGVYIYLNNLQYQIDDEDKVDVNINLNLADGPDLELIADSDNDGLIDVREEFYGTDPYYPDTDGDGYSDGYEILNGYNPRGEGKLMIYVNDATNTNN